MCRTIISGAGLGYPQDALAIYMVSCIINCMRIPTSKLCAKCRKKARRAENAYQRAYRKRSKNRTPDVIGNYDTTGGRIK